jgi:hypothetical protein
MKGAQSIQLLSGLRDTLTTLGEMAEGSDRNQSRSEPEQKQPQDTQRYVPCLVGYVMGKRRE